MGVIDESALEKISFIANLTKHIHVHSPTEKSSFIKKKEEEVDSRELAPYFPDFVWLLRDFSLKLVDEQNNPISSRQYLEMALGRMGKDKSKNEIRKTVTAVFPFRDCVTLVRPVVDEEDLQNLENIKYEDLRDKFKTDVTIFTERILQRIKPKLVYGQAINGSAFLTLCQAYVDALNTGSVPTIRSAWENVSEIENKKAMEASILFYNEYVDEKIPIYPIDQEELYLIHLEAFAKAKNVFSAESLGEQKQELMIELEKKLTEAYDKLVLKNDQFSEKICKELLHAIKLKIDEALTNNKYTNCNDLVHEWKQLIDSSYSSIAKGKWRYIALSEILTTAMPETIIILDNSIQEKLKKKTQ